MMVSNYIKMLSMKVGLEISMSPIRWQGALFQWKNSSASVLDKRAACLSDDSFLTAMDLNQDGAQSYVTNVSMS